MVQNEFSLQVATVNGSGSQSSNLVLAKTLFRLGLPVGAKNLFPSNIAGLPTWFTIRVSGQGHLSRQPLCHLMVAMNKTTLEEDLNKVVAGGVFIYNSDLKFNEDLLRKDVTNIGISFRALVKDVSESVKLKKLLTNMAYVGVVAQLLGIESEFVEEVIADQFRKKPGVIEVNQKAFQAGFKYSEENLEAKSFPIKVTALPEGNKDKIFIDGNTASALGLLHGGCTFMSWYPITPSSSVAESFTELCEKFRKDSDGQNTAAVVQAEDELSAISMVIGAGWTGARAVTPTSGPGLSLMAEAAGLSYFAEVPAVIWDVQRVGPSTGLPTRTMQGDLEFAYRLGHGDTEHIVLIPGTIQECFEFGQKALDLAERLQTLVIVLSDLDLGMNMWVTDKFDFKFKAFDRGKVLRAEDLNEIENYSRYADVDGDGIPQRTLPGTPHPGAAYFTRGTGHNEDSTYSEDNEVYAKLLDRLKSKHQQAKAFVPEPVIQQSDNAKFGIIAFGSSDPAVHEVQDQLAGKNISSSYLRVRALPLTNEVEKFIENHEQIFVVEQNRDQQMLRLLRDQYPHLWQKLQSVTQYDGLPLSAEEILPEMGRDYL